MMASAGRLLQQAYMQQRACCQLHRLLHHPIRCLGALHIGTTHQSVLVKSWPHTMLHVQPPMQATDFSRGYAKKGKESKKDKKGKKGSKVTMSLSPEEIAEVLDNDKFLHQLTQALGHLKQDYTEQLKLRTSAGVFDQLMVETVDGKFPLLQLGQVANKNPQLIVVNMTTAPQYIPAVKEAIMNSGMNLNPQQDGTTLFVPIPKVTREHREMLSKNAKALCEKTKDKMRDIQKRFMRDVKKRVDTHSEDLLHSVQDMIQSTANDYMAKAEMMMEAKQQEILNK